MSTYWSPDLRLQRGVWGAKVAGVEMLKAFLRYSKQVEAFEMFVPPSQESAWLHFRERLYKEGVPIERFHLRPVTELPNAIRKETFTAFHCNPPPEWGNMLLLRQHARHPFACIATLHSISYAFLLPYLAVALYCGVTEADKLICSSTAQKKALSHLLARAAQILSPPPNLASLEEKLITHIPLGVDTERYRPMDKRLCRRLWHLPEEDLLVLYLGRLSVATKMDFLPLFRAFRETLKAFPNAWLILAGQEQPIGFAQQLQHFADEVGIRDKLITLTDVPEEAKPALYNCADIFVSLSDSLQESFGLAVLEAMACGLPVIASDWDGYRELVVDGETGFLVPTWWGQCDAPFNLIALAGAWETEHFYLAQCVALDWEKLESALQTLLADSELRREMGHQGRLKTEAYDWQNIVPRYEQLWQESTQFLFNPVTPASNFALPQFFETFQHYPSQILREDTQVMLTPLGVALSEGKEWLLLYDELRFVLDEGLLELFKEVLSELPCSFGTLLRHIRTYRPDCPRLWVEYHILWLAKQGFVALKARG